MTRPNLFWVLVAVPSILIAATALSWIGPEAQARARTGLLPASTVLDFTYNNPELIVPMSAVTQVRQLSQCDDILATNLAITAGAQTVDKIAKACTELAEQILNGTPTLSIAHLVRAWGLHEIGDTQRAENSFLAARITGPNEGWLAARRLRLFFDMGLSSHLDVQQAAQMDAITVLQDRNYNALLPQLYVSHPDLRDWLKTAIDGGKPRDLRRFVAMTNARLLKLGGTLE